MSAKIIFITGTDTGVGKTAFTGLLLTHLRSNGLHALAMKPFCCGSMEDVEILGILQDNELKKREINPYYFAEPVAPLVAARKHRRIIKIGAALERLRTVSERCDWLLIEGAGGLLTPLGENFSAKEMIDELKCPAICVAVNRLGTINHSLLTIKSLQQIGAQEVKVALMGTGRKDASAEENARILSELAAPVKIYEIPFFAELAKRSMKSRVFQRFENISKKIEKTLAELNY